MTSLRASSRSRSSRRYCKRPAKAYSPDELEAESLAGEVDLMQITIRLLASYRKYLPADHDAQAGYVREVVPGSRVAKVLGDLPLPDGEAVTFLVNGRHAGRDQVLQAGDVVAVFPAMGGG